MEKNRKKVSLNTRILSLIMIVSLLMVNVAMISPAFATGDGEGAVETPEAAAATASLIYGGGTNTTADGLVTLSKTATQIGNTNEFTITLQVTVKDGTGTEVTPADAAHVALVIDSSGSVSISNGKLTSARTAAKAFIDSFLGEGTNEGNKITIVEYDETAHTVSDLTDNITTLKAAVDATKADGGTNIQSGIHAAQAKLAAGAVEGVANYIIVLTDGDPTYSYGFFGEGTAERYKKNNNNNNNWRWRNETFTGITGANYNNLLGDGNSYTFSDNNIATTYTDTAGSGETYTKYTKYDYDESGAVNHADGTIWEANQAKAAGTFIYPIFLGSSASSNANHTLKGISSLKDANNNSYYLTASNTEELTKLYQGISGDIVKPTNAGTVTDPMGKFIDLKANSFSVMDGVTVADDGESFTWDVKQATPSSEDTTAKTKTYTLSYNVTLDTQAEDFVNGAVYKTNGDTTFTYRPDGDTTDTSANFEKIPSVSGTAGTADYTIEYYFEQTDGSFEKDDDETENKVGTIGSTVNAGGKTFLNYSYDTNNAGNVQSGTVTETPELVLKRYYKLDTATVTVNHYRVDETKGDTTNTSSSSLIVSESASVKIGDDYLADVLTAEELAAKGATGFTVISGTYEAIDGIDYTSNDLEVNDVTSSGATINIYYKGTVVEGRTPVEYKVVHEYYDQTWKLVDGDYVVSTNATPTYTTGGDVISSFHGMTASGTVAPENGYVFSADLTNGANANIMLDKSAPNADDNVIIFRYIKPNGAPNEPTTTFKVTNIYREKVVDPNAPDQWTYNVINSMTTYYVPADGEVWYEGESINILDASQTVNGKLFSGEANNTIGTVALTNGANEYTNYYTADARVSTTVTVIHSFVAYKEVIGEGGVVSVVEDLDANNPTTVTETPAANVGENFSVTQFKDQNGYVKNDAMSDTYTNVTVLANGATVINIVYVKAATPGDFGDVTVERTYTIYDSYVDVNGIVQTNIERTLPSINDVTIYGDINEVVNVAGGEPNGVTTEGDGFEINSFSNTLTQSGNDFTFKLEATGQTAQIHYVDYYSTLGTALPVTVVSHFGTYEQVLNAGRWELSDTWTEDLTLTTAPVALAGTWYLNQAVSVNVNDFDAEGYSHDSTVQAANFDISNLRVSESGLEIHLYYSNEEAKPAVASVNVTDTYLTYNYEIVNGVATWVDRTEDTSKDVARTNLGTWYVGEKFTADAADLTGTAYTNITGVTPENATATTSVTIDPLAATNDTIEFVYERRTNTLATATVTVVHQYATYNWAGEMVILPEKTVAELPVSSYAGAHFTATPKGTPISKAVSGGTWKSEENLAIVLAEGENVITLIYDAREATQLTVTHEYYYVAEDGSEVMEGSTQETISGIANKAWVGLEYVATAKTAYDMNGTPNDATDDVNYVAAAGNVYSKVLVADQAENTITLKYTRDITEVPFVYEVQYFSVTNGSAEVYLGESATDANGNALKANYGITLDAGYISTQLGDSWLEAYNPSTGFMTYSSGVPTYVTVSSSVENNIVKVVYTYTNTIVPPVGDTYYNLTVNYVDVDGAELAASDSTRLIENSNYSANQRTFDGYTFLRSEGDATSGVMNGDKEVTFVYSADTVIEESDPPLNPTPAVTETPPATTTPPVTTVPPVQITDAPPPLVAVPSDTPAPTDPADPTDPVEIPEPSTPLAGGEETPEVTITEPETPLAAGNGAAWALVNLILTVFTGILSVVLLIGYFRNKREDEEYEDEDVKRKGAMRLFSIAPAIAAIVVFILTEDMSLPMTMVDQWTILMAIIALVQCGVTYMSRKVREEESENA